MGRSIRSKLGWGKDVSSNRSDFDIITSQESLLRDFPAISDIMKKINPKDFIDNIIFQWCIYHFVPLHHLKSHEAYVLFYENLLIDPDNELIKLFHYLNKPFNRQKLHKVMKKPSSTNLLRRKVIKDQSHLLNGWKDNYSAQQIKRANYILAAFGLDHIYDKNGYPVSNQIFKD